LTTYFMPSLMFGVALRSLSDLNAPPPLPSFSFPPGFFLGPVALFVLRPLSQWRSLCFFFFHFELTIFRRRGAFSFFPFRSRVFLAKPLPTGGRRGCSPPSQPPAFSFLQGAFFLEVRLPSRIALLFSCIFFFFLTRPPAPLSSRNLTCLSNFLFHTGVSFPVQIGSAETTLSLAVGFPPFRAVPIFSWDREVFLEAGPLS